MKKIITLVMVLVAALALGACSLGESSKLEDYRATLYFANEEYIITGSEDLEKLIPEERDIQTTEESLGMDILQELKKGSENPELETLIPETSKVLDVKIENALATVNFAREGLNGSSMEEAFTINQIVATLLELDEVDRVQFLVDGEVAESLMGHFDTTQAFEDTVD